MLAGTMGAGLASTPAGAASGPHFVALKVPSGVTGDLQAVSCFSASNCTAVGESVDSNGPLVALHWNGQGLSDVSPINPGASAKPSLVGVSCPTATFCMAVGSTSSGFLAEEKKGSTWTTVGLSGAASTSYPHSVTCVSDTDCWAVGQSYPDPFVAHWTGGTFTPVSAQLVGTQSAFHSVSCSHGTCFAVGSWSNATSSGALFETSTGGTFASVKTPTLPAGDHGGLWAVSCPTAAYCVSTGEQDTSSAYETLGEIYKAGHIKAVATPDPTHLSFPYNVLYGVSCVAKSDCWTSGQGGAFEFAGTGATKKDRSTIAASWNGDAFTQVPSKNPGGLPNGFTAVSCARALSCLATGIHYTNTSDTPLVEELVG